MKNKVIFFFFIFSLNSIFINSINLQGISKWIINFPENRVNFLDYEITNSIIEDTGVVLDLKKNDKKIRLITIKKINYDELIEKFYLIEKKIIAESLLKTDRWYVVIKDIEINFGLKGEIIITINFKNFRIKINERIILELIAKLEKPPVFYFDPIKNDFNYTLNFKNIKLTTGNNDSFLGWNDFFNNLIKWIQIKIKERDREIIALVVETRIYGLGEFSKETKRIIASEEEIELEKPRDEKDKPLVLVNKGKRTYQAGIAIGSVGSAFFGLTWVIHTSFSIILPIGIVLGSEGNLTNMPQEAINIMATGWIPLAGPFVNIGILYNILLSSKGGPPTSVLNTLIGICVMSGVLEIISFSMILCGYIVAAKFKNYNKLSINIQPLFGISCNKINFNSLLGIKIGFN